MVKDGFEGTWFFCDSRKCQVISHELAFTCLDFSCKDLSFLVFLDKRLHTSDLPENISNFFYILSSCISDIELQMV